MFFVPLFGACSFSDSENEISSRFSQETSANTQVVFNGILEANTLSVNNRSTHILRQNEGIQILLKSSKIFLSSYENTSVKVTGIFEEFRNGNKVLEIQSIEEIEEISNEDVNDLETKEMDWKKFQEAQNYYSFSYPEAWKVLLARKVLYLQENGENIIKITMFDNSKDQQLSDFVKDTFTQVTVNKANALRVKTEKGFDLYLKNISKIIKIRVYNDFSRELDKNNNVKEKWLFTFLESFLLSSEVISIQKCGGAENINCADGFRCEIYKGNMGICKDITKNENYDEFGSSLKNSNTSSTLELTEEDALEPEVLEDNSAQDVDTNTIEIDDLPVLDGAPYVNKHMNYTLLYPKSWWYKSFGSVGENIWHTEFGEKEIENIGEGSMIVEIKKGKHEMVFQEVENNFIFFLPRNDTSHFKIYGSNEYKEMIKGTGKSLQNI
jgi:hypothetical protein